MSDPVLKPDLCVIGAGAAGLSVASVAAAFGVPVVLVERGRMGGECLNVGCVPSKALLAAAEAAEAFRRASPFGIASAKPRVDWPRVRAHVDHVIAAIAPNDSAARYGAMGVQVIHAEARFTDARTLQAGAATIRARRYVIATGSVPAVPPIPGLAETPFLTNDTLFSLPVRPDRLLILGGGPVGVEMAQAFRRLGSEVALVEQGALLGKVDPELTAHLVAALERDGVEIHAQTAVASVSNGPQGPVLRLADGRELAGSHLLVATGRRVVKDGLGLEAAGVDADPSGILVDAGLRTRNKRIYAIGDCAGGPHAGDRLTHMANHHAGLVIRNALFRLSGKVEQVAVPRVVYTEPELATVGLDENEARKRHKTIRVLRWPYAENDRAQAERLTAGEIKVITTASGVILGAGIVGARAGDLVTTWTLAVKKGLSVADLRDLIVPYPTLSEVSKRAAVSFYAGQTRGPMVRRVLSLLRAFG